MSPVDPTTLQTLNTLGAALRKTQADNRELRKSMEEMQALLAKNSNAPRWIEDIPGKRVQYFATIDITIAANSTSRVEGTYSVSTDGPFVCTGIAMYWQRTTAPYNGIWAPATAVEARIAPASQGIGFGYIYDNPCLGSFDVEFSESGADRNWQNNPFASALFAPSVGGVYVLPVSALFGRSAVVICKVQPTVAQLYAGKVQVILLGYKIIQGDTVQP